MWYDNTSTVSDCVIIRNFVLGILGFCLESDIAHGHAIKYNEWIYSIFE